MRNNRNIARGAFIILAVVFIALCVVLAKAAGEPDPALPWLREAEAASVRGVRLVPDAGRG